ncbi:hypothetical protein QBC32DRAFT_406208 [Pseudoneurospora amorphoporcata]|uniref:Uncharacterized protein n=1 Tax=Pseudoneurospora amorphoporcata TaxID=241081 RepID=A0AAN6NTH1_9PEZI|nr:hypothetical protein QBC32DRAFT_406208 [Pseudoneurospora amorphoporcata]
MNKGRIRRRIQQEWNPASPLVSEAYRSDTVPIQEDHDVKKPLLTDTTDYLSAQESQGVGDDRSSLPSHLEDQQCPHDWNFPTLGQRIGLIPGHERSSSITGSVPPLLHESEGGICVEDEEDHLKWSLTREVAQDTQSFSEEETVARYLACPFYKHDPKTFSKPKWKSCAHPGPYQDDIPEQATGPPARQSSLRRMNDDKILELLPYRLQSVIEEDEDLRYLPASSQQRIVLRFRTSVEQLLNSDSEENNPNLGKAAGLLPCLTEETPRAATDANHDSVGAVTAISDLDSQTWNCPNPWINDNHPSVPEGPTLTFFGEFPEEPPHIPQHQLSWYGTAVDPSDTPEIDAYMYEPRRPRRLKMQPQDHGIHGHAHFP